MNTAMPDQHAPAAMDGPARRLAVILGIVLLLAIAFTFGGVLDLKWTNWDDQVYVLDNADVQAGDYAGCWKHGVNLAYTPLPQTTFVWEWQQVQDLPQVGDRAWRFHLDNLLLYLLVVGLAYVLLLRLGLQPAWAALATALFALHPMRVESVAWITERKDLLYGLFTLASLLLYLRWRDTGGRAWLPLALAAFLLAAVSKVQAVALPVSLLLIDGLRGRRLDWPALREKWLFFVLALFWGIVGLVMFGAKGTGMPGDAPGLPERLLSGLASIGTLVIHTLLPLGQSPLYPQPGLGDWALYACAAIPLGMAAIAIWQRQRNRSLAFGVAFFLANVAFVALLGQDSHIYAVDRLAFVPTLGLVFALGMAAQSWVQGNARRGWAVGGAMAVACISLVPLTRSYIPAWTDSGTLWSHAIDRYPGALWLPYVNRGQAHMQSGEVDLATKDADFVVARWPQQPLGLLLRGTLLAKTGQFEQARADFDEVVALYPASERVEGGPLALYQALRNRAGALMSLGQFAQARQDYLAVVRMNPQDQLAFKLLGSLHAQLGEPMLALASLSEAIRLVPDDPDAYARKGQVLLAMGNASQARTEMDIAIAESPAHPDLYLVRAHAWLALGQRDAALADVQQVQRLGGRVDPALSEALQSPY